MCACVGKGPEKPAVFGSYTNHWVGSVSPRAGWTGVQAGGQQRAKPPARRAGGLRPQGLGRRARHDRGRGGRALPPAEPRRGGGLPGQPLRRGVWCVWGAGSCVVLLPAVPRAHLAYTHTPRKPSDLDPSSDPSCTYINRSPIGSRRATSWRWTSAPRATSPHRWRSPTTRIGTSAGDCGGRPVTTRCASPPRTTWSWASIRSGRGGGDA